MRHVIALVGIVALASCVAQAATTDQEDVGTDQVEQVTAPRLAAVREACPAGHVLHVEQLGDISCEEMWAVVEAMTPEQRGEVMQGETLGGEPVGEAQQPLTFLGVLCSLAVAAMTGAYTDWCLRNPTRCKPWGGYSVSTVGGFACWLL